MKTYEPLVFDSLARTTTPIEAVRTFLESDNVYAAIIGERAYQERRWPGCEHEAESYLVYIESYVNEAKELLSRNDMKEVGAKVQGIVRKIAALAVAEMEHHGVVRRSVVPPPNETLETTSRDIAGPTTAFGHGTTLPLGAAGWGSQKKKG